MKALLLMMIFLTFYSCMKTREEYKDAIDVQKQESREDRDRGSNDKEGMGMDE